MSAHKLPGFKGEYKEAEHGDGICSELKLIKEGNQQLREDFIVKYKPFILRITSVTLNKFVDAGDSDEFSIALAAFNEAIDRFGSGSKSGFLSYAEKVIKSRVIDYLRKNTTNNERLCGSIDTQSQSDELEEKYPAPDSYTQFEAVETREEIENIQQRLKEFNITLNDLLYSSPKHRDSRELCFKIAEILSEDEHLYSMMVKNKSIPRNELLRKVDVHENTLAKNRKYIIAVCLILRSDLDISKRVLKNAIK